MGFFGNGVQAQQQVAPQSGMGFNAGQSGLSNPFAQAGGNTTDFQNPVLNHTTPLQPPNHSTPTSGGGMMGAPIPVPMHGQQPQQPQPIGGGSALPPGSGLPPGFGQQSGGAQIPGGMHLPQQPGSVGPMQPPAQHLAPPQPQQQHQPTNAPLVGSSTPASSLHQLVNHVMNGAIGNGNNMQAQIAGSNTHGFGR